MTYNVSMGTLNLTVLYQWWVFPGNHFWLNLKTKPNRNQTNPDLTLVTLGITVQQLVTSLAILAVKEVSISS